MRSAIPILLLLALPSCGLADTSTMYTARIVYGELGPGNSGWTGHNGVSTPTVWVRPDLPYLQQSRAIIYGMALAMGLKYNPAAPDECLMSASETSTDLCSERPESGHVFQVVGPQQLMDDCVTAVSWWNDKGVTVRVE